MVKFDAAGQGDVLPSNGVGHALGVKHLSDALGRHLGLGKADDGKRAGNDARGNEGHVLDNGENIAAGQAGGGLHPPAAQIHDQHRRQIQQERRQRGNGAHGHIAPDEAVHHNAGSPGHPLMLPLFGVERPDDPDAPQTLPHDLVLPVNVLVGDFPDTVDSFADDHDDRQNYGNKGQHGQRQRHVLAKGQHHAAHEQHRNGHHGAGQLRRDPAHHLHVVGAAGHESGRSQLAEFLEAHLVDLAEHGGADVGAEGRHHVVGDFRPQNHRSQSHQRYCRHHGAAFDDVGKIRLIDAPVENLAHDGGQQQVADGRYRHGHGGGDQPLPIGLQIMHHFSHFSTSSNKTSCMCAAP